jgi:hypothetical protein
MSENFSPRCNTRGRNCSQQENKQKENGMNFMLSCLRTSVLDAIQEDQAYIM